MGGTHLRLCEGRGILPAHFSPTLIYQTCSQPTRLWKALSKHAPKHAPNQPFEDLGTRHPTSYKRRSQWTCQPDLVNKPGWHTLRLGEGCGEVLVTLALRPIAACKSVGISGVKDTIANDLSSTWRQARSQIHLQLARPSKTQGRATLAGFCRKCHLE
jgi:hypothetical protein